MVEEVQITVDAAQKLVDIKRASVEGATKAHVDATSSVAMAKGEAEAAGVQGPNFALMSAGGQAEWNAALETATSKVSEATDAKAAAADLVETTGLELTEALNAQRETNLKLTEATSAHGVAKKDIERKKVALSKQRRAAILPVNVMANSAQRKVWADSEVLNYEKEFNVQLSKVDALQQEMKRTETLKEQAKEEELEHEKARKALEDKVKQAETNAMIQALQKQIKIQNARMIQMNEAIFDRLESAEHQMGLDGNIERPSFKGLSADTGYEATQGLLSSDDVLSFGNRLKSYEDRNRTGHEYGERWDMVAVHRRRATRASRPCPRPRPCPYLRPRLHPRSRRWDLCFIQKVEDPLIPGMLEAQMQEVKLRLERTGFKTKLYRSIQVSGSVLF